MDERKLSNLLYRDNLELKHAELPGLRSEIEENMQESVDTKPKPKLDWRCNLLIAHMLEAYGLVLQSFFCGTVFCLSISTKATAQPIEPPGRSLSQRRMCIFRCQQIAFVQFPCLTLLKVAWLEIERAL